MVKLRANVPEHSTCWGNFCTDEWKIAHLHMCLLFTDDKLHFLTQSQQIQVSVRATQKVVHCQHYCVNILRFSEIALHIYRIQGV